MRARKKNLPEVEKEERSRVVVLAKKTRPLQEQSVLKNYWQQPSPASSTSTANLLWTTEGELTDYSSLLERITRSLSGYGISMDA